MRNTRLIRFFKDRDNQIPNDSWAIYSGNDTDCLRSDLQANLPDVVEFLVNNPTGKIDIMDSKARETVEEQHSK